MLVPMQDCFTDALSSVQTGRPFWHWAINVCTHEWYKKEQGKNHTDIIKAIDDMVASVWNVTEYPLPSWMAKVAGANTTKIKCVLLWGKKGERGGDPCAMWHDDFNPGMQAWGSPDFLLLSAGGSP